MADLSTIKPGTALLDIKFPGTLKSSGVTVELMSLDDERMKKIKRAIIDRRQKLAARDKNFNASEIDDNTSEICFGAMIGWTWGKDDDGDDANFNGSKPEFTRANVMAVFAALPWFREQIDIKVGERESFFAK